MMSTNNNKKELNEFVTQLFQKRSHGVLKNKKAYDRARDRKDKRLYEFDEEVENESEQKS